MTARRLLLLGSLVALAGAVLTAQTANAVFQQALAKERASGRLDDAIALYRAILADPKADRAIKARSLLQIGSCYERLGSSEAPKTYQQLIADFSDQAEIVQLARQRLSVLAVSSAPEHAAPKPIEASVRSAALPVNGLPSRDGRHVVYLDHSSLWIRDIGKTEGRMLAAGTSEEFAGFEFASSRDSLHVAYTWSYAPARPGLRPLHELRVVAIDGSGMRTIVPKRDAYPLALDWSPDGKQLLVFFDAGPTPTSSQLALVSVADGAVTTLKTGLATAEWPNRAAFSGDGQFAAYSVSTEKTKGDVFLLATDGSGEKPLVQHPANDTFLSWAPNGRDLLFTSDRTGTTDLWQVRVSGGKTVDLPQRLARNLGDIVPITLTSDGALYYRLIAPIATRDVYVASLDPSTSRIVAPPASVTTNDSHENFSPQWSPDGRSLAYEVKGAGVVTVVSIETGQERRLPIPIGSDAGPYSLAWSADSRSLLIDASPDQAPKGKPGLYILDLDTGQTKKITTQDPDGAITESKWVAGTRSVVYQHHWHAIILKDLDTGSERTLYEVGNGKKITSLSIAPDGQTIAFREFTNPASSTLMVKPLASDAPPKGLLSFRGPPNNGLAEACCLTWAPDGRHIIYADSTGPQGEWELWRVEATGGSSQRLGTIGTDRYRFFSMHPDGGRIAFGVMHVERPVGTYVLENFLGPKTVR